MRTARGLTVERLFIEDGVNQSPGFPEDQTQQYLNTYRVLRIININQGVFRALAV